MTAMLWGAGFGLSAVVLVLGLRPKALTLLEASRQISATQPEPAPPQNAATQLGTADLAARAASPFVVALQRIGLPNARTCVDLALIGTQPGAYLAKKVLAGAAGVVLPVPAVAAMLAFGVAVPIELLFGTSAVAGLALFFTPDVEVRKAAEEARAEAREALDVLLGFTATSMAAGDGIEAALDGATAVGQGPAFDRFRAAGHTARTSRQPVWVSYGEAADELGLPELRELAATISLAGGEGAKIAESLTAKAGSLRGRRNAERQAKNAATTEKMHLPLGIAMVGFLMVIAFPPLYQVLTGF